MQELESHVTGDTLKDGSITDETRANHLSSQISSQHLHLLAHSTHKPEVLHSKLMVSQH